MIELKSQKLQSSGVTFKSHYTADLAIQFNAYYIHWETNQIT